jgi:hypothetical protein
VFSWFEHAVPIIILNSKRKSLQSTHIVDLASRGPRRSLRRRRSFSTSRFLPRQRGSFLPVVKQQEHQERCSAHANDDGDERAITLGNHVKVVKGLPTHSPTQSGVLGGWKRKLGKVNAAILISRMEECLQNGRMLAEWKNACRMEESFPCVRKLPKWKKDSCVHPEPWLTSSQPGLTCCTLT